MDDDLLREAEYGRRLLRMPRRAVIPLFYPVLMQEAERRVDMANERATLQSKAAGREHPVKVWRPDRMQPQYYSQYSVRSRMSSTSTSSRRSASWRWSRRPPSPCTA